MSYYCHKCNEPMSGYFERVERALGQLHVEVALLREYRKRTEGMSKVQRIVSVDSTDFIFDRPDADEIAQELGLR